MTSFLERVQLQATAQAIWNWFSSPRVSLGTKLLRGFTLIVAGLLVVLWPAIAMALLGFVIGALLFVDGVLLAGTRALPAVLTIALALGIVLAAIVLEPPTTKAAFGEDA